MHHVFLAFDFGSFFRQPEHYPVSCTTLYQSSLLTGRNKKKMSTVNTAVQLDSTLLELKSKVSLKSLTVKCIIYLIPDSQERSLKNW